MGAPRREEADLTSVWLACGEPHPDAPAAAPDVAVTDRVRFVALGDTGTGDDGQRAVAAAIRGVCAERGCDLGLLLGDDLYPSGPASPTDPALDRVFSEPYGDLGFPLYLAVGNHDYGQEGDLRPVRDEIAWAAAHPRFVLPSTRYRFTAGPALFLAIDTDWIFFHGGEDQGAWLAREMAADDRPWTFVFGHHTALSDGPHGDAGRYDGRSLAPFYSGTGLRVFFAEHVLGKADVYLCGHDHSLQWIPHSSGTSLVVSGAGAKATTVTPRVSEFAAAEAGFAWIEATRERLLVVFYGADGRALWETTRAR